jgi:hypothetical protein
MDTFSPSLAGVWVVSAEWPGDVEYEGAVSPSVSVKVGGNEGLGLGVAEVAVISGVAAVAVIAAVLAVSKSRRRKAEVRRRGKKKKGSR